MRTACVVLALALGLSGCNNAPPTPTPPSAVSPSAVPASPSGSRLSIVVNFWGYDPPFQSAPETPALRSHFRSPFQVQVESQGKVVAHAEPDSGGYCQLSAPPGSATIRLLFFGLEIEKSRRAIEISDGPGFVRLDWPYRRDDSGTSYSVPNGDAPYLKAMEKAADPKSYYGYSRPHIVFEHGGEYDVSEEILLEATPVDGLQLDGWTFPVTLTREPVPASIYRLSAVKKGKSVKTWTTPLLPGESTVFLPLSKAEWESLQPKR